jgi:hypothetical protein
MKPNIRMPSFATVSSNMRPENQSLVLITVAVAWGQDPHELVRRSIAQDQLGWVRMEITLGRRTP